MFDKNAQYKNRASWGQDGPKFVKTAGTRKRQPIVTCGNFFVIVLVLVLFTAALLATDNLVIFEDWSFRLFDIFAGCLPGGICNL